MRAGGRRYFLAALLVSGAAILWSGIPLSGSAAGESSRFRVAEAGFGTVSESVETGSSGCLTCHRGIEPMHASPAVRLGCIACHGGDAAVGIEPGTEPGSSRYREVEQAAHVAPRYPERWASGAARGWSAGFTATSGRPRSSS